MPVAGVRCALALAIAMSLGGGCRYSTGGCAADSEPRDVGASFEVTMHAVSADVPNATVYWDVLDAAAEVWAPADTRAPSDVRDGDNVRSSALLVAEDQLQVTLPSGQVLELTPIFCD